jgi:signal transduction histidine kinase
VSMAIFRNREFKLFFYTFCLSFLLFGSLLVFYVQYQERLMREELIRLNVSIIGGILNRHPELESSIVPLYSKQVSMQDLEAGLAFSKRYGIDNDLPFHFSQLLDSFYHDISFGISGLLLFLFGLSLFLIWRVFDYVYTRIRLISLTTEEIMRGKFDTRFPDDTEGDLLIIGLQFNQMAKRLQLTLDKLKEEKLFLKKFISDISHQIKTPLSSLMMFNELMMEGAVDSRKQQIEFLEKSNFQLKRIEWLIYTLLKLSRLEAGTIPIRFETTDLCKMVENIADSLTPFIREKHQHLHMDLESPSIQIPLDPKWIREALENMIKNAVDYTPQHGTITVRVLETNSLVEIIVEDTGIGISPEDLPHVFKRFYRGKNSSDTVHTGNGVGLALTKLIIEKHGGYIKVDSELNKGTKFTLTLRKYH